MNASEGSIQPEFLLTTEDIVRYYEGGLIPELRYGNTALADGSFQKLAFKSRPVLADSYATSGYTYFVNTDHLYAAVARGADFTTTPLSDQSFQDVFSAKVLFQGNFVVNGRKFQNKVISQVA